MLADIGRHWTRMECENVVVSSSPSPSSSSYSFSVSIHIYIQMRVFFFGGTKSVILLGFVLLLLCSHISEPHALRLLFVKGTGGGKSSMG